MKLSKIICKGNVTPSEYGFVVFEEDPDHSDTTPYFGCDKDRRKIKRKFYRVLKSLRSIGVDTSSLIVYGKSKRLIGGLNG
jgi:hypothetical protein